MIILRLLLLLTNLHLKLLSTQGTGADKLLSTQRVKKRYSLLLQMLVIVWHKHLDFFETFRSRQIVNNIFFLVKINTELFIAKYGVGLRLSI